MHFTITSALKKNLICALNFSKSHAWAYNYVTYVVILLIQHYIENRYTVLATRRLSMTTCWACVTLTLCLPEQMFQMAHLLMMENNYMYANVYCNPSEIVGVMVQSKLWPLTLNRTSICEENNCIKLFWNPSTIVELWSGQILTDARTYTKLSLWQLCLAQRKRARQKV